MSRKTYGFNFPDNTPQPHIELFGYSLTRGKYGKYMQDVWLHPHGECLGDFEFLSPYEHLVNFIRLAWPTEIEINVRGYTNKPMLRILEALCEVDDLGIAGSAGSSKSFAVAAWALADWFAAPTCTSTFMASTALDAMADRAWGHAAKLFRTCRYPVGKYIDYKKSIVFEMHPDGDAKDRDYINAIKALAFPPGAEGKKAVDTTRGRHNKRVRMIVDELPEMESYVNKVRANLAANLDFMYIGIGNPAAGENPHRELCKPADPKGWDSITVDSRRWKTRTGEAIFLHGEDSPNFEAPEDEPPPFPYLQTRASLKTILDSCYGNKNALEYFRNAIGFWPTDTVENSILTQALIRASNTDFEPLWAAEPKITLATLDCALTSGGDKNIVTFGTLGTSRYAKKSNSPFKSIETPIGYSENRKVLFFQGQKGYSVNQGTVFEEDLAKQVVPDLIEMKVKPENFAMDVDGAGGTVMSAIIKEWMKYDLTAAQVVAISSMGKPSDRVVSSLDPRKCEDVYDRRVTEYWFSLRVAIQTRSLFGLSIEDHPDLVSELCTRQYTYRNKKAVAETKKEMKERIGHSPDNADSAVYLCELARRRGLKFIDDQQESVIRATREKEDARGGEIEYSYAGDSQDEDGF